MTSKKMIKAAGIAIVVLGATKVLYNKVDRKFWLWLYRKEEERAKIALEKVLELNNWSKYSFQYASDSGTVPIYTYAKDIDIESMRVPKGYVLHKMMHATGAINYVLGAESKRSISFTYYPAYLYLESAEEWAEMGL